MLAKVYLTNLHPPLFKGGSKYVPLNKGGPPSKIEMYYIYLNQIIFCYEIKLKNKTKI